MHRDVLVERGRGDRPPPPRAVAGSFTLRPRRPELPPRFPSPCRRPARGRGAAARARPSTRPDERAHAGVLERAGSGRGTRAGSRRRPERDARFAASAAPPAWSAWPPIRSAHPGRRISEAEPQVDDGQPAALVPLAISPCRDDEKACPARRRAAAGAARATRATGRGENAARTVAGVPARRAHPGPTGPGPARPRRRSSRARTRRRRDCGPAGGRRRPPADRRRRRAPPPRSRREHQHPRRPRVRPGTEAVQQRHRPARVGEPSGPRATPGSRAGGGRCWSRRSRAAGRRRRCRGRATAAGTGTANGITASARPIGGKRSSDRGEDVDRQQRERRAARASDEARRARSAAAPSGCQRCARRSPARRSP